MRTALCLLLFAAAAPAIAQSPDTLAPPVEMTAQEDHRRVMDLLGIEALRPGPSGDPTAPNAANTDESKASPYTHLPDPLIADDGTPLESAVEWWHGRRSEIVEHFDREMYGRMPDDVPDVRWEVVDVKQDTVGGIPVVTKKLAGVVDNAAYPLIEVIIDLTVVTPASADDLVPAMIHFGFNWPPNFRPPPPDGPTWQQHLLERGWGYATLIPTSYQADNGGGLTKGIIGLTNEGRPRDLDDWGTLRAWAWGASRALDYLESDPDVDARRVGIEGLSRYGKAALVAMAYEPRFAVGFIGSSGAGGAKILRRIFGEQVENLASSGEYHWFAGNFVKYAGPLMQNDLPVDAHQLVALCAPRPVFISVGSPDVEGRWIDARGMFLAGVHAGPVYELLGRRGLGADAMPPMETGLLDGEIAFRQHSGGHTTGPNWPYFLDYAEPYVRARDESGWVTTWGTAVQLTEPHNLPPEPGLAGNTLRQIVRVSLDGERIRLHFSNTFGESPVVLREVRIAASIGGGEIDATTDRRLLFAGQPDVTIGTGASVTSDPVDFELGPQSDVAITIHFGGTDADIVTGHPGSRTTSYLVEGNVASAAELADAVRTDHWYVISGIDVERDGSAVATLGDSITDGRGSGTNEQNRWPDELARRLQLDEHTQGVAVLNVGIGGNCVTQACLGPAAIERFDRDVSDREGVRWLIILEGVNDIGSAEPQHADSIAGVLTAGYRVLVERAHADGIRVFGATILPFGGSFYDAPEREAARQAVNEWIRTSGVFDAVIDLDAALRDPENPTRLLPSTHTGDHLHPNEYGYRLMAEAIDLSLFAR